MGIILFCSNIIDMLINKRNNNIHHGINTPHSLVYIT